jgi:hypothetical protein
MKQFQLKNSPVGAKICHEKIDKPLYESLKQLTLITFHKIIEKVKKEKF